MKNFIKRLLGRQNNDEERLEAKSQRAHDIKNDIQHDMSVIMLEIEEVKQDTTKRLDNVNRKLGIVGRQIAIATGGLK